MFSAQCPPGQEVNPDDTSMCMNCETGYYKEGTNRNPCLVCPGASTTMSPMATDMSDCCKTLRRNY